MCQGYLSKLIFSKNIMPFMFLDYFGSNFLGRFPVNIHLSIKKMTDISPITSKHRKIHGVVGKW